MWTVSPFENEFWSWYYIRKCVDGKLLFVMIVELKLTPGWVVEFSGMSWDIGDNDRITRKASFCSRIAVIGAIISFFWLAKAVTMLFTADSKVSRRSRNCWHSVESNSADPPMICRPRPSTTFATVTFSKFPNTAVMKTPNNNSLNQRPMINQTLLYYNTALL